MFCTIKFQFTSLWKTSLSVTLDQTMPDFNNCKEEAFKNIVGKREIAGYQDFLVFPKCFLPYQRQNF